MSQHLLGIWRFVLRIWPSLLSGSIAALASWYIWRINRRAPVVQPSEEMPLTKAGQISALNMAANAFADPAVSMLASRRSRLVSMRIRKNFALQTSVMLKENQATYVGAFAISNELKTIRRGPLSYIPLIGDLFRRDEFMRVKSAILVFVTCRAERTGSGPRLTQQQQQPMLQTDARY
uniref:General secretion pathway protein D n=1 Tax=Malawimonas jakobiformis TaxID=136089 RepID=A0A895KQT9_MALJA|nr:general secretion pathway protein D [Malawimonas jakobiformis]